MCIKSTRGRSKPWAGRPISYDARRFSLRDRLGKIFIASSLRRELQRLMCGLCQNLTTVKTPVYES